MTKKVLDVGQCNADNYRINEVLTEKFDVELHRAHSHDEAITMASSTSFDLILINRLLDADGSEGMAVLKSLQNTEATQSVPTMIVSNFEDAQTAAVAAGAVPGFGKSQLNNPATFELLGKYLG